MPVRQSVCDLDDIIGVARGVGVYRVPGLREDKVGDHTRIAWRVHWTKVWKANELRPDFSQANHVLKVALRRRVRPDGDVFARGEGPACLSRASQLN